MKARDGEKNTMREWLERVERCKESGGEDCSKMGRQIIELLLILSIEVWSDEKT